MKLKLEVQNGISFLSVSEFIGTEHISLLKAGLNKLFQDNKKVIVLDFSSLAPSGFQPMEVIHDISSLQLWAVEAGAQVLILSPIEGWGDATSRAAALELLTSPLGRLISLENRLKVQLRKLEGHKQELEKRIASIDTVSGNVSVLRRENGELKRRTAVLETQIRQRLQNRTQIPAASVTTSKIQYATKTLISILEREGVLPVVG